MPLHFDFFTLGETTLDIFMTLRDANQHCRLHEGEICFKHGAKIEVERYDMQMGGNATNVAVGLSRLGVKTTIFSEIGDNELALHISNALAKEHVDRGNIVYEKHAQLSMSVIFNFKSDRTLFVEDVERKHNFHFENVVSSWMYLTSLGPEWKLPYKHAIEYGTKNNIKIACNPGSAQLREMGHELDDAIRHTEIFCVNKEEAEQIIYKKEMKSSNEKSYLEDLAKKLQKMGAKTVVITNGQMGSYALSSDGKFYHQGLFPGKIVERTGAGDAYTTGFLGATFYGLSIETAMKWGAVNAASVVEQIGAEAGLLTKQQIESRAS